MISKEHTVTKRNCGFSTRTQAELQHYSYILLFFSRAIKDDEKFRSDVLILLAAISGNASMASGHIEQEMCHWQPMNWPA